ncbi:unnamed protein product [Urochloa decumbens]|uniref:Protein kinase domain-containing protein n=1 Tax=Urochloa decumbens TaxID=240449 RepID=A0ABC9AT88_9POAL
MPAPLGLTSCILIAVVQCLVAAIAPACCTTTDYSGDRDDVFSVIFPSFKAPDGLSFSWDAGILSGVLHLTADGVYQPPVQYLPDPTRSTGHARLTRTGFHLALGSEFLPPWSIDSSYGPLSQEASFNTSFTMSVSRSRDHTAVEGDNGGGLVFEVLPRDGYSDGLDRANYFPVASTTSGGNISVEIGNLEYYYHQGDFAVYVSIAPDPTQNLTPPAKYTVWIDYDAKLHNMSVYVDGKGRVKPAQATLHAPINISAINRRFGKYFFGLFASKNRLLPSCQPVVYSWNLTVDRLSVSSTSTAAGTAMPTDDDRRRRRRRWLLIARVFSYLVPIAASAAVVFAVACCLLSRFRSLTMKLRLSKAMRRLPGVPREFSYGDIKRATRNFHESMRLGSGGFGAVYKGAMIAACDGDDGRQRLQYVEVAVKKFTRKEDRSYDDFLAEVAVINRLRHKNIVPLLGWCYENEELLLIYQYMPNGSLDQHLFSHNHGQHHHPILQWETRYDVIKDVAAGLHYVHHEYERAVLHRDIKASNIMLDAAFHGRLGDFGLARVVALDKSSFTDIGVAGTWGFIAPEYAVSHKATRHTDVYAFGVLVLEVVTGKRSLGAADSTFPLLVDWVWWLYGEGRLLEAVDDEL